MEYTIDELKTILDLHKKWIHNLEGGARAVLYGADMRGAILHSAKDISQVFITRAEAENY